MPPLRTHLAAHALATLAVAAGSTAAPVDFERQIEPILRTHCLECHGPLRQSAGLRLDTRRHAEAGGASGLPILGGTLETNELWRRVSAEDDEFRMPRFADPLAPAHLDLLRRWVEQGTPWPEPEPEHATRRPGPPPAWQSVYDRTIAPTLPWLVVLFVVALVTERLKLKTRVRLIHVLLVASVLVATHQFFSAAQLQAQHDARETSLPAAPFGDPPVPRRPDHGRRLHGTYYRGNCERDDRLYNGGSYRTCAFHVALVDAEGTPLHYGDPIPESGLFARFEIERARNTTEKLFTPAIMDAIFLSEDALPRGASPRPGSFRPLETVEPMWRWQASWPLPTPGGPPGAVSGLVYVYRGAFAEGHARDAPRNTMPHYALGFEIESIDGRIGPASELWLGALYVNSRIAAPPEPGKVPFESWFSWRPLPEIEGEPTGDPELLGLPEHLGH